MTRGTAIRTGLALFLSVGLLAASGCIKPKITLFSDSSDEPLHEYTLQGSEKDKILMITIKGFISDSASGFLFSHRANTVQETVAQLKKAEKDKNIKAVILKIDSPGGSVTASDILYHELVGYRERTGTRIVAVMMSVAASGGYYIAMPADAIIAHPTTVTGSIGVIFMRPNVSGLMGKIGLDVEIDKSGKNKDMGSPFRKATPEEQQIMQGVIDDMAGRFISLAAGHRKLSEEARAGISTARIYNAAEALQIGLIDQIGYLDDAIARTAKIAGISKDAKVVVYRRKEYPNDNLYNPAGSKPGTPEINLVDLGIAESVPPLRSGFYYLWLPGQSD